MLSEQSEAFGKRTAFLRDAENALNLVFGAALGAICGDKVIEFTGWTLLSISVCITLLAVHIAFLIMFVQNFMAGITQYSSLSIEYAILCAASFLILMAVPGAWLLVGTGLQYLLGIDGSIFPFNLTLCLLTAWAISSLVMAATANLIYGR